MFKALTKRDPYPMPKMDDRTPKLSRRWTPIADTGKSPFRGMLGAKTAFACHAGVLTHSCTDNLPRPLDIIVAGFKWRSCVFYHDDVIVLSQSVADYIRQVDEVLTALQEAGVSLKLKKCHFFMVSIRYLGHIV